MIYGFELGDIVAVTWKDHEMISDVQLKLVAVDDDYYWVATSYNSYDHHNNDFIRILKCATVDLKVLEKGEL